MKRALIAIEIEYYPVYVPLAKLVDLIRARVGLAPGVVSVLACRAIEQDSVEEKT